jgi:ribose transport system ATP-binding protein
VLRDGCRVLTRTTQGLTERELVAAIVGRPLEKVFPPARERADTRACVLELDRVTGRGVNAVSLQVHPGEILGIAGLLGSGRSELLQLVFGLNPRTGGEICFDGYAVDVQSVRQAMDLGIAYVPEHRDTEGAFAELSVRQNLVAADIASFSRRGRLDHGGERRAAQEAISRYGIKASGEGALMSSLSGGNQQKVILARWMRRKPRLLLLDEPTQGVDVGARADAYRIIREATGEGVAAILVSSDFEELADMSDRVLILSDGQIAGEVDGHGLDRHTLTELVFTAKEVHP